MVFEIDVLPQRRVVHSVLGRPGDVRGRARYGREYRIAERRHFAVGTAERLHFTIGDVADAQCSFAFRNLECDG